MGRQVSPTFWWSSFNTFQLYPEAIQWMLCSFNLSAVPKATILQLLSLMLICLWHGDPNHFWDVWVTTLAQGIKSNICKLKKNMFHFLTISTFHPALVLYLSNEWGTHVIWHDKLMRALCYQLRDAKNAHFYKEITVVFCKVKLICSLKDLPDYP